MRSPNQRLRTGAAHFTFGSALLIGIGIGSFVLPHEAALAKTRVRMPTIEEVLRDLATGRLEPWVVKGGAQFIAVRCTALYTVMDYQASSDNDLDKGLDFGVRAQFFEDKMHRDETTPRAMAMLGAGYLDNPDVMAADLITCEAERRKL